MALRESQAKDAPELGPAHDSWLVIQLASTACVAIFVIAVEGLGGIAAWNLAPLLLALGSIAVVRSSLGSTEVRVAGTVFWVAEIVLVLALHAAWHFDLGQIATRSSTAGLIFLVTPLYSVALGIVLAGVSMGLCAVFRRKQRGA